jgi:Transglutaminase-like superfamily
MRSSSRLSESRYLRALEAALELVRASVSIRLRPASATVALLGTFQADPRTDEPVGEAKLRDAARVGGTVTRVAGLLPWHPTCLRQALAVQRMLRRRRIACRLHLGVTHPRSAQAHAWVTVEDRVVVGRAGIEAFVPLAAFG